MTIDRQSSRLTRHSFFFFQFSRLAKKNASHRKCTQAVTKRSRKLPQVSNKKFFAVTCNSVINIFKIIVCKEILLHEGIWDTIRVDHGTEACLMLFAHNLLRNERGNLGCEPYVQTQSRQVSTIFPFLSLLSKVPARRGKT